MAGEVDRDSLYGEYELEQRGGGRRGGRRWERWGSGGVSAVLEVFVEVCWGGIPVWTVRWDEMRCIGGL